MALNLQDVQSSTQWLYIAEGKFRKARWVALSSSTGRALQHYIDRRFKSAPHSPDSPLLLQRGISLTGSCGMFTQYILHTVPAKPAVSRIREKRFGLISIAFTQPGF